MSAKHGFLLRYQDGVNITQIVIPIQDEDYRSDIGYKENIQDIFDEIFRDGGLWINEKTIIPFHRIVSMDCWENGEQEKIDKKKPTKWVPVERRFNKHRRNNRFEGVNKSQEPTDNKCGEVRPTNGTNGIENRGDSNPQNPV